MFMHQRPVRQEVGDRFDKAHNGWAAPAMASARSWRESGWCVPWPVQSVIESAAVGRGLVGELWVELWFCRPMSRAIGTGTGPLLHHCRPNPSSRSQSSPVCRSHNRSAHCRRSDRVGCSPGNGRRTDSHRSCCTCRRFQIAAMLQRHGVSITRLMCCTGLTTKSGHCRHIVLL